MDNLILRKLDEGKLFYHKNVFNFTETTPETREILIKTPSNDVVVYYKSRFSANTEMIISVMEDVSVDSEGTPLVVCNNDRSCGIESNTKLFIDPVNVVGGENIWPARISARPIEPPVDNPVASPVTSEMGHPIRCKPETYYNLKLEKLNSSQGYIDVYMRWYEHDIK